MQPHLRELLRVVLIFMFLGASPASAALVHVPPGLKPAEARVVVVIHGCLQSAESMALGAGWNALAERENLVVIYPQAPQGSNPIGCWNWYLPENQSAASGQLKSVMDEIRSWKRALKIEKAPVYVTGISSGGATVSGLLACFPREFAAGAIHSGPSFGLARTLEAGKKVLQEGPGASPGPAGAAAREAGACQPDQFAGPVMVIQGSTDAVVHPSHADRIVADFAPGAKAAPAKSFDAKGVSYTITDTLTAEGRLRARKVFVTGLGHAWSGFVENLRFPALPTQVPFFHATGPSATNLIWEFFQEADKSKR